MNLPTIGAGSVQAAPSADVDAIGLPAPTAPGSPPMATNRPPPNASPRKYAE